MPNRHNRLAKFVYLVVVGDKRVIVVLYVKGYGSKFITSINFLIIRAVYIAVNNKILYFFIS